MLEWIEVKPISACDSWVRKEAVEKLDEKLSFQLSEADEKSSLQLARHETSKKTPTNDPNENEEHERDSFFFRIANNRAVRCVFIQLI